MEVGFWKIPTCQWDGHYTSMEPSGNIVFIDLQPPRTRRNVKRIRHEKRFSRNKSQRIPMVSQRSVEPKIHERTKTGYTLRQLEADSEPAIGQKSSPSYEVKDGDICRAVAAIANLPTSTLPDSPFILALGTLAAQNVPPQTGTLAQRPLEEWERTLCENKEVAILAQMQAGRLALIQKSPWQATCGRQGISGRPGSFHSRNDQDSARKANHPLIAQIIKPAGSSDPPPQIAQSVAPAAINTPAPVRPRSSSSLKRLTWGTHGCHTWRVTTV